MRPDRCDPYRDVTLPAPSRCNDRAAAGRLTWFGTRRSRARGRRWEPTNTRTPTIRRRCSEILGYPSRAGFATQRCACRETTVGRALRDGASPAPARPSRGRSPRLRQTSRARRTNVGCSRSAWPRTFRANPSMESCNAAQSPAPRGGSLPGGARVASANLRRRRALGNQERCPPAPRVGDPPRCRRGALAQYLGRCRDRRGAARARLERCGRPPARHARGCSGAVAHPLRSTLARHRRRVRPRRCRPHGPRRRDCRGCGAGRDRRSCRAHRRRARLPLWCGQRIRAHEWQRVRQRRLQPTPSAPDARLVSDDHHHRSRGAQ
jgi:hypothetical protein